DFRVPSPATAPTHLYTLSLHDALPISDWTATCEALIEAARATGEHAGIVASMGENLPEETAEMLMRNGVVPFHGIEEALAAAERSEEHTSELQSRENLVCRLLLEKKKK